MRWFLFALLAGCTCCKSQEFKNPGNLEAVKNILLTERRAHMTKDVSLLLSNFADTVLDISKGVSRKLSLEESRARFSNYFSAVEFYKWDDVTEPLFTFSDDSTMAVVNVQKQVIVKEYSAAKTDTTGFDWTAVYRRINNQWKLVSITSTNK